MRTRTQARRLAAIDGLISAEVGELLYELARQVPAGQAVVEIGAYKGKSSCYLGEGARDGAGGKVHTVDPWDSEGNATGRFGYAELATREAWQEQVRAQGLVSTVRPHQMRGHEYAATYRGPKGGLLFIDGDHSYEAVKRDFEAWQRHLAPGATVVFDDCDGRDPGVWKFVQEIAHLGVTDLSVPPTAIVRLHANASS